MTKNIEKLSDAASIIIKCDYCDDKIGGFGCTDAYDVAEAADECGWKVNNYGKVKCPRCTTKMRKTNEKELRTNGRNSLLSRHKGHAG